MVFTLRGWKLINILGKYDIIMLSYQHENLNLFIYTDLIIVIKTRNQSLGLSVDEWINKLWYIQTMEYYSVLKWNKLSSHKDMEEMQMYNTILKEISPGISLEGMMLKLKL